VRQLKLQIGEFCTNTTVVALPAATHHYATSCWNLKTFMLCHWSLCTPARCYMPFTSSWNMGVGVVLHPCWQFIRVGYRGGVVIPGYLRPEAASQLLPLRHAKLITDFQVRASRLPHKIPVRTKAEVRPFRVVLIQQVGQAQIGGGWRASGGSLWQSRAECSELLSCSEGSSAIYSNEPLSIAGR